MCVVIRRPCGSRSASQSRFVSAIASAKTSHIETLQPSATSWRTSSRPIPLPPPVTTAILPAKSFMMTYLPWMPEQPMTEPLSIELARHTAGVVGVEGGAVGARCTRGGEISQRRDALGSANTPRPPQIRANERLGAVLECLLDRNHDHRRGLFAVDSKTPLEDWIDADPGPAVNPIGLVCTGDQENQSDARILHKVL